ncbi:transglutaminase family protein [Desertibaculum subflavum]|uniref:transglutaminase family protein n=1 Tax=Desertibaculum subflavum TaxID=2268458 RepID=UPI000E6640DA
MKRLSVRHRTVYSYAAPVAFGDHRMTLRPRDSHDLRLVDATLAISPSAEIRWVHDVFGNSIAIARFAATANELTIESRLELERYALDRPVFDLDPGAARYPFIYSPEERADLGRLLELHHPDPKGRVTEWAKAFVHGETTDTLALLSDINLGIKRSFRYEARDAEGTQTPLETIERGAGSCRDFALLMIEALRSLGFAARFVSGYLYDPASDARAGGLTGGGATHAWLDVYLPGAGWVEYDPTNGLVGSANLIRIAVARDASQAVPIAGSFTGRPGEMLGMRVEVEVREVRTSDGGGT